MITYPTPCRSSTWAEAHEDPPDGRECPVCRRCQPTIYFANGRCFDCAVQVRRVALDDPPVPDAALNGRIKGLLATLTARQRVAFDLFCERAMRIGEVAEEMKIGHAAASRLVSRVRERFRQERLPWPRHPTHDDDPTERM